MKRVLVVGASSGIGRAVVEGLAADGSRVFAVARRLLEDPPKGCTPARADVRDPAACAGAVAGAVGELGGLDALVYTAGLAPLKPLEETTAGEWHEILETNLVGAALVTAAALPHLRQTAGKAVYLSSHSVRRPWPGLVAYAASKAALDTLITGWRAECPSVSFSLVVVGPTLSAFADGWPRQAAAQYFSRWEREGYWEPRVSRPADVAAQVTGVLASPCRIEEIRVMPPAS